jgi:hypothetical protein
MLLSRASTKALYWLIMIELITILVIPEMAVYHVYKLHAHASAALVTVCLGWR